MQPLKFVLSKKDALIFSEVFVEPFPTYFYQWSEFEVGTAMGLGNINHSMTGSKQKHTDTKSLKQYNGAR